jgi:hypothetical protein
VRDASLEELTHGHAHGPGGHHQYLLPRPRFASVLARAAGDRGEGGTMSARAGLFSSLLALGVLALAVSAPATAASRCEARSGPARGTLLELYTSEGCSSCPPADRWFSTVARGAPPDRLSLLAFHVDYWDALGWKDRFSQHAFTVRQSSRVRAAGSRTVYTPQLMLSQGLALRWNQDRRVREAIAAEQAGPSAVRLALSAAPAGNGHWFVDLGADADASLASAQPRVYLALYEDGLQDAVDDGENAGATLHHDRVVRGLFGPWPLATGSTRRRLDVHAPSVRNAAQLGFTAFVQSPDGRTWQALSLPLAGCR